MRLYKIVGPDKTVWVGTKSDVVAVRKNMMAGDNVKRKDIVVDEVDVPTDKVGLLTFLNARE